MKCGGLPSNVGGGAFCKKAFGEKRYFMDEESFWSLKESGMMVITDVDGEAAEKAWALKACERYPSLCSSPKDVKQGIESYVVEILNQDARSRFKVVFEACYEDMDTCQKRLKDGTL